jgi:hypothetical protein
MEECMKKAFIMASAACIPILLCAFTGCETTEGEEMLPYNAIIVTGGTWRFKEDFLRANMTGGSFGCFSHPGTNILWNENGEPEDTIKWEYDETLPRFRTFIITEQARMDEVFSVCPDIDFEKEMVAMYFYTSVYRRERKIKSITLDNKNLKIEFKIAENEANDASMPLTRFLVIKMDKLDIDTVEFTLLNP